MRRSIPAGFISFAVGDLYKIGKTTNPKRRMREAQTWLPAGELIGIKPFWEVHTLERTLLCGIANHWLEGEWHAFSGDGLADFLVQGFRAFDDHDRNKNSLDFIYWINGSGMGEVINEQNHRRGVFAPVSAQSIRIILLAGKAPIRVPGNRERNAPSHSLQNGGLRLRLTRPWNSGAKRRVFRHIKYTRCACYSALPAA